MDAKQLGVFIAERRKELGLTQAQLAEKLHVTDKAVSRWERGVGLPDINSIETLADALEVSLIELMRNQRNEEDSISTKEAEKLLVDTIELSRSTSKFTKSIGGIILAGFAAITITLLLLLVSDWNVVVFSAGSILAGLLAWAIPIWKMTLSRTKSTGFAAISSFGFALTSIAIQFFDIANEVHTSDWWAIEDTIDALAMVVVLFCSATLFLNVIMVRLTASKKDAG